mmetsp:Transcript_2605/g.4641  ORF Transcript_2605/g.4641 Transcript_2605/m.4641 type:complete len:81 (+) Transcript_2605:3368-3610(+)
MTLALHWTLKVPSDCGRKYDVDNTRSDQTSRNVHSGESATTSDAQVSMLEKPESLGKIYQYKTVGTQPSYYALGVVDHPE